MVILHTPEAIFSIRHTPTWLMLAFSAGAVNAGALLACQRFVTHVTGTVTQIGIDVGKWRLLLEYMVVLICFILGAMASVLAIDWRDHKGKQPLYAVPLITVAALLGGVAIFGHLGWFGRFGGSVETVHDFVLLSILSFAMGLQNAAVATVTGLIVRTTHLTGPATDLGVQLARSFFTQGMEKASARRGVLLRAGIIVAFSIGAAVMFPLVQQYEYETFLIPAAVVLLAAGLSFRAGQLQTTTA